MLLYIVLWFGSTAALHVVWTTIYLQRKKNLYMPNKLFIKNTNKEEEYRKKKTRISSKGSLHARLFLGEIKSWYHKSQNNDFQLNG